MGTTDVQKNPEAAERVRIATASTTATAPPAPAPLPPLTGEALEAEIRRVLGVKSREDLAAREAASARPEPDWASLTEEEATDLRTPFNVQVIEHEVPSYMDVRLKDPDYVTVWVNRDQRRMGEVLAQGYEPLKREHIAGDFTVPLKFDSEGYYIYMDVIAMRVHKRILFSKRRRIVEKSINQLRRLRELSEEKTKTRMDNEDPLLGNAFRSGRMGFYSTSEE